MFSNLAPHRVKPGWGRSGPDRKRRGGDPTGFRPVVKEFDNIEPGGAAVALTVSGGEETPPVLGRW